MSFVSIVFNLFTIGILALSTFYSLRSYVRASFNKIDSLEWGMAFFYFLVYLTVSTLLELFKEKMSIPTYYAHRNAMYFLEVYAALCMFGVAVRLRQAKHSLSNLVVRATRVVVQIGDISVLILLVISLSLYYGNGPFDCYDPPIAIQQWTNVIKIGILSAGMVMIPAVSYYGFVKFGLGCLVLSESLNFGALLHGPITEEIILIEDLFAMLGILSGLFGVLAIQRAVNLHDEFHGRSPERRTEPTSLKLFLKKKKDD